MRTFISIDLPTEINGEIKKIQDKLPKFSGKKTELRNLHLTLKFLGEIDDDKIKDIRQKLSSIKFALFKTEIKYSGFFDNKKYGVVWLYLNNCENLQKAVDESLADLFPKEPRFMSHLTIARVKNVEDKNEFLKKIKSIKLPKIKFIVDKFHLKKSVLCSEGPEYETIEEYKLGI